MKKLLIVNYGIGNILSVKRAFEHCGADVIVSSSKDDIKKADRIVVPGVGAFSNCISALENSDLKESVLEFAASGKPYLGICVGMQMMLDESEEFGTHAGLGIIKGNVTKIEEKSNGEIKHKVPFVGWKSLENMSDMPLFKGILPEDKFYFVHSYKSNTANQDNLLASYRYDNLNVAAVIGENNIYGAQFHPEKSGGAGLRVIKNFLDL
jgi:glutamine amidotransferase